MRKVVKKLLVIAMVLMMSIGALAGCGSKDEGTKASESYKVGVVVYDNTDLQQQAINKYLTEHIGPAFNVEFIISDAIKDSNGEISFLENCASKGAKGIMAYYTVTDPQILANKCKELGLYYILGAANPGEKDLEAFKSNELMLGGIGPKNGDYDASYEMAKAFLEDGARDIAMATGGKDMGVQMFIDRFNGVQDAIKDFEASNSGEKVNLTEFAGFPSDAWFAQQAQVIASNPDAIIASFSGEFLWVQPLTEAGKAGEIKLGTLSSLNDVTAKAFEENKLHFLGGIYPQMTGLNFAVLYNAMSGHAEEFKDNGNPVNLEVNIINVKSADDMKKWMEVINAEVPPYSADDIKKVCKAYNEKATYEDLVELTEASGYEDIVARRAAE